MGLDLTLIPVDSERIKIGSSLLLCERDYALFDDIKTLEDTPAPQPFSCHKAPFDYDDCDQGYGEVTEDCYGKKLRCVTAGDLSRIETDLAGVNRGIIAYMRCLPEDKRVVLFWH